MAGGDSFRPVEYDKTWDTVAIATIGGGNIKLQIPPSYSLGKTDLIKCPPNLISI